MTEFYTYFDGEQDLILECDAYENRHYYTKDYIMHRADGPAVEWPSGYKIWYKNGKRHRLDGPAVITHKNHKFWYFEDKLMNCQNQEKFEKLIRLEVLR